MSGRPSHQEGTDKFTVTSTPVKGANEAGEATAVSHLGCPVGGLPRGETTGRQQDGQRPRSLAHDFPI